MAKSVSSSTLKHELGEQILRGRCAYCRRPAAPDRPLTREHVIPRARGGRRKDVRIIVPACAHCNQDRGCQELVQFLLVRPRRISAFLDYLHSLTPDSVQQMDLRVFAELYAAVWLLNDCRALGLEWRAQLRRMCVGRTLHRRRYAARRVVGAVGDRLGTLRERGTSRGGPSCLLPVAAGAAPRMHLDEPLDQLSSRLLGLLSLLWEVSAEDVQLELARQLARGAHAEPSAEPLDGEPADSPLDDARVLPLDGWKRRHRHRRMRVDRRSGRRARRAA